jgi:two-component system cell cycle sensor histidine kinase/response regulator CckA
LSVRTAIIGKSTALVVAVTEALAPRAGSLLSGAGLDDALVWLSNQDGAMAVLVEPDPADAANRIATFRQACGSTVAILVIATGESLASWSVTPGLQPAEWCDAMAGPEEWARRYDALAARAGAQDAEHLHLVRALEQSRRLESVGRLAAGVAHDFNNLLTSIMGNVDLLAARVPDLPELGELQIAAERAVELTRQLLTAGRPPESEPEAVDVDAAINECSRLCARVIGEDVELRCVRGPGLWHVRIAPGKMQQVLMNLVLNARDAMPEGGALTFRTRNVVLEGAAEDGSPGGLAPGEYVQLTVEDTGHGMDARTLARIGEPYFTTKPAGEGTGLGLATVMGIVRRACGDLLVDSLPGTGTRVRLWFPRSMRPCRSGRPMRVAGPAARGSGTLLLLEDDDLVRRFAARTLTDAGYDVLDCANPTEGLEVWSRRGHSIRALVTDVVMPVMSGPALATRLRGSVPDLPVVFISGHIDKRASLDGFADVCDVLAKPFSGEALVARVAQALGSPN